MKPDVVVDVGNTRLKWGRCLGLQIAHGFVVPPLGGIGCDPPKGGTTNNTAVVAMVALPPDDPAAWDEAWDAWRLETGSTWVLSGVHPARRDRLAVWLRERGATVRLLSNLADLPLRVALPEPVRVGMDRVLNAVAANARRPTGIPALLVDAGSAVTVDRLGGDGSFEGGAIFPGLRLMSQALHDYTALLPLVEVDRPQPAPATDTASAIRAGIGAALLGGIGDLVREMADRVGPGRKLPVYLTGGDGPRFQAELERRAPEGVAYLAWPEMTLEGIRLSAEALP